MKMKTRESQLITTRAKRPAEHGCPAWRPSGLGVASWTSTAQAPPHIPPQKRSKKGAADEWLAAPGSFGPSRIRIRTSRLPSAHKIQDTKGAGCACGSHVRTTAAAPLLQPGPHLNSGIQGSMLRRTAAGPWTSFKHTALNISTSGTSPKWSHERGKDSYGENEGKKETRRDAESREEKRRNEGSGSFRVSKSPWWTKGLRYLPTSLDLLT